MSKAVLFRPLIFAGILVAVASACTAQGVIGIVVIPAAQVRVGETVQLAASTVVAQGPGVPIAKGLTWESLTPNIAVVDSVTGVVTGVLSGKAEIRVTDSNTQFNAGTFVTVMPGDLKTVTLYPPPGDIPINTAAQLKAEGTFVVGTVTHTEPIPATSLAWTPAPAANATITPKGWVIDGKAETLTINATYIGPVPVPLPNPPIQAIRPLSLKIVEAPAKILAAPLVQFIGQPHAGDRSVNLLGNSKDIVSLYQFDAAYIPQTNLDQCGAADLKSATPLMVLDKGGAQGSFTLAAATPQTIPLALPLLLGKQLCASRTPDPAATPNGKTDYSAFESIDDPNDYGRLRTYITAGAVITNQQSAATTSTANIYADMDIDYSWARAGKATRKINDPAHPGCNKNSPQESCALKYHRGPGLDTFFAIRLSPIPVAAPITTTPVPATGPAPPATTSLNVLTSQQSAHIVMGGYMPVVATRFYNKSNVFTLAPTFRFGFDTLLNPSASNGTNTQTNTGTTPQLQTGSFSSVYSFYAGGLRIAWEQLARSTDHAPQTWGEINFMFGKYSNLPSYICGTGPQGLNVPAATNPPQSACGQKGGVFAAQPYASRTSIPRLALVSKAQFPNYPFIFGIDANLAQYSLGKHIGQVDYMNKAGNDIRIYLGVTFNLATLMTKLGATSF